MSQSNKTIDQLYDLMNGDEDARACKDIPEEACNDQPRNFFSYLIANLLNKIADELTSAKLILPWLFATLGVPATLTSFLVPIREAGVLIPQLAVAAIIRKIKVRKNVWLVGAILSATSLLGMAYITTAFTGMQAGVFLITLLVIYSLARGICSVAAKDVLGKTIAKNRRGRVMGWSAALSGIGILSVGLTITQINIETQGQQVFTLLLLTGGSLWLLACVAFYAIKEQPGATEGGANALSVAVDNIKLIKNDKPFRDFIIARTLLLSIALAPPFYVLLIQHEYGNDLSVFGMLMIASAIAAITSSPFWGFFSDRSSKQVMILAVIGTGIIGMVTSLLYYLDKTLVVNEVFFAIVFFMLNVMHGGARIGRKTYLVDMATTDNRAAYTAVSNTLIGILMLLAGSIGVLGDIYGPAFVILFLSIVSLVSSLYIKKIKHIE